MIKGFVSVGLMSFILWLWGDVLCHAQSDESQPSPRDLFIASRDIIRDDELARRIFARGDSLPVVVHDTIVCLNLFVADLDIAVEAIYPECRDYAALHDSLKQMEFRAPRCSGRFDPSLHGLSTASDSGATILFHVLDSTLRSPYYLIIASLVKNRRIVYDEGFPIPHQDAAIWYMIIFDRRGHAEWIWSAEAEP